MGKGAIRNGRGGKGIQKRHDTRELVEGTAQLRFIKPGDQEGGKVTSSEGKQISLSLSKEVQEA